MAVTRPKILLHSCCGPCSTACIERLLPQYDVTVFYANSNITDEAEYRLRLETQKQVVDAVNRKIADGVYGAQSTGNAEKAPPIAPVQLMEGPYDPDRFLALVRGYEDAPENGDRCPICFRMRLAEAADTAKRLRFDYFTTTLPVSPHKNFSLIAQIGEEEGTRAGIPFEAFDFKKKDGFKRSIELSKEYDLYRQNFCGCEFSRR